MADQKDQDSHPPAEDPTFLPLKKRAMAEKSLPGFIRAPASDDSDDSDDSSDSSEDEDSVDSFAEEFKKRKLEELQIKAYYAVLHAFNAETSTMSDKRNLIIRKLMNEWKISQETYNSFSDKIAKDSTCSSSKKEMQIEKPLSNSEKKESSSSSWGNVDPVSLVGKSIRVRMIDKDDFEELIIKEYDAKREMHRLESTDSNAMEMDDYICWIDVRQIPRDDIVWERGLRPNFDRPNFDRPKFDPPKQCTARRSLF